MPRLTVDLTIPIHAESLISTPALTFSHWLPVGKEKGISVAGDDIEILLWFDLECLVFVHDVKGESDLTRYSNVLVNKVRATIDVDNVSDDLATYMLERKANRPPYDHEAHVHFEYVVLGNRVYESLLGRVNRLIAYARAVKGQFWLLEHEVDTNHAHSFWTRCNARGAFCGSDAFRFLPGTGDSFTIVMQSEKRYIGEADWSNVAEYVKDKQKIPFVSELLSGAERLAGSGYSRSALTEAVAALEVAVSNFSKSAQRNEKLSSIVGPRMGVSQLHKQFERLGFTNTVNYLLPLIVPEAVLPADTLACCRAAISARQNVVHNGQRDVPDVHKYIRSIRTCCEILDEFGGTQHLLANIA